MTEFEAKLIELLGELANTASDINFALNQIESTLNDIHFEQAYPGSTKRLADRAEEEERRKNGGTPIPF